MPASAVGNYILDKGFNAAAALTKFRAVKSDGNPEAVTPVTAVTDVVLGIVQHDVTAGEITKGKGASVRMEGISLMEASEAINEGQLISMVTDGRGAVAAATERVIGVALSPAAAAGDYFSIKLDLPGTILA